MTEDFCLDLLSVVDLKDSVAATKFATVSYLTARLGIERRVVQNNDTMVAFLQRFDLTAVLIQREHRAIGFQCIVTMEGRWAAFVFQTGVHLELACCASLLLLSCHRSIEPGGIDCYTTFTTDIRSKIQREAVGVVQLECGLTVKYLSTLPFHLIQFGFQYRHPMFDGFKEAFLFLSQDVHDALLTIA